MAQRISHPSLHHRVGASRDCIYNAGLTGSATFVARNNFLFECPTETLHASTGDCTANCDLTDLNGLAGCGSNTDDDPILPDHT